MIELILKSYLEDELKINAYFEKFPTMPNTYLLIEKTGSDSENHIYSTTFAIQSIAPSLYAAASLNETVKAAMENFVGEEGIASCKLNSDYNFTDTQSKTYRYQAVYDITAL